MNKLDQLGLFFPEKKCERGLGFRNIWDFNLAMLEKEGWKLLTNPNSLVARLLKAKYFKKLVPFNLIGPQSKLCLDKNLELPTNNSTWGRLESRKWK